MATARVSAAKDATCPPVELLGAYKEPEPATAKALTLVLAYRDCGHPARLATKYAGKVAAAVCVKEKEKEKDKDKKDKKDKPLPVVFDIDDTLIRDKATHFMVNPTITALHAQLVALGAAVHLVTARANDADTREWTRAQLEVLGITGYAGLHLAPASRRDSMTAVSRWKMEKRRDIGRAAGAPIVLTVGDQWSDLVTLSEDADIDALDAAYAPGSPWKVVRPNDGVSLWGLKLRAFT